MTYIPHRLCPQPSLHSQASVLMHRLPMAETWQINMVMICMGHCLTYLPVMLRRLAAAPHPGVHPAQPTNHITCSAHVTTTLLPHVTLTVVMAQQDHPTMLGGHQLEIQQGYPMKASTVLVTLNTAMQVHYSSIKSTNMVRYQLNLAKS